MKLPVIAFSSAGTSRWTDEVVKNPTNPSYNPNTILGFSDTMDIYQRFVNTAATVFELLAYQ